MKKYLWNFLICVAEPYRCSLFSLCDVDREPSPLLSDEKKCLLRKINANFEK